MIQTMNSDSSNKNLFVNLLEDNNSSQENEVLEETTFIDPKTKIIVRPLTENVGYVFFVIGVPQEMDLGSLSKSMSPNARKMAEQP